MTAEPAPAGPYLVALHQWRPSDPGRQGVLALEWALPSGLPEVPVPPEGVRVVRRPHTPHVLAGGPERPEPGAWVARLVQAVVEVLAGDRPVLQLMRWLDLAVYEQLTAHVSRRPGRPAGTAGPRRAVRSVHLCELQDDVIEAVVIVGGTVRARAVALRLEAVQDRWRCIQLTIL